MKYLVLLIITAIFSNCNKDSDDNVLIVTIENQTDIVITDIKLYVNIGVTSYNFTDSLIIDKIDSKNSYDSSWDLNNLSSVDGGFVMFYNSNSDIKDREFGYFSNGNLIDKNYHIKIESDTVLITKPSS